MKTLVPEVYSPECTLTDWCIAITDFHSYYHQLATYINQRSIEQELTLRNTSYIGQCPVNFLEALIRNMEEELKNLGRDIDQLATVKPSSIAKNYKRLTTHTRILKELNQQAQNRLYLINLPSS